MLPGVQERIEMTPPTFEDRRIVSCGMLQPEMAHLIIVVYGKRGGFIGMALIVSDRFQEAVR